MPKHDKEKTNIFGKLLSSISLTKKFKKKKKGEKSLADQIKFGGKDNEGK